MPNFENMTQADLKAVLDNPGTPVHERERAGEVWNERFPDKFNSGFSEPLSSSSGELRE